MMTEQRLIDADELKKSLYKSSCEWTHGEHPMILEESDIDNAPTVSAVEVVRCEKCKHKDTEDCPMSYYEEYEGIDAEPQWITDKKAQYCSYGEVEK
jgi:exonuclease I